MRALCEQCTTAPKGIFVMRLKLAATAALVLVVAGCGYSREDRVTGGAAAGAATGAAVGIVGGPVGMLAGAAIGGVAGGVTGAETTPSEVNLGRPPWSDSRHGSGRGSVTASADVRRTQQDLASRGLYGGPIDGVMGPQTRAAISRGQGSGTGGMSSSGSTGTRSGTGYSASSAGSSASTPIR